MLPEFGTFWPSPCSFWCARNSEPQRRDRARSRIEASGFGRRTASGEDERDQRVVCQHVLSLGFGQVRSGLLRISRRVDRIRDALYQIQAGSSRFGLRSPQSRRVSTRTARVSAGFEVGVCTGRGRVDCVAKARRLSTIGWAHLDQSWVGSTNIQAGVGQVWARMGWLCLSKSGPVSTKAGRSQHAAQAPARRFVRGGEALHLHQFCSDHRAIPCHFF